MKFFSKRKHKKSFPKESSTTHPIRKRLDSEHNPLNIGPEVALRATAAGMYDAVAGGLKGAVYAISSRRDIMTIGKIVSDDAMTGAGLGGFLSEMCEVAANTGDYFGNKAEELELKNKLVKDKIHCRCPPLNNYEEALFGKK